MPRKKKKILTIDDLIKFCQEQKFLKFSSKETGYQLAVKIPTTFEVEDKVDDNHRGMMKLKFRIFHTGLNRNNSYVSKESATKAMNTIADRPVLAAIHQLDDGTWDFEGHEIEVVTDENGNEELRYIESQVGSFSSEPAFWEHDEKLNKDYVCAYAYISREYTRACEILESKNGSKNSCELFIDELAYNAKEKYLDLIDFYVNASTLLGSQSDGTQIKEGMEGSRADIVDFSVDNNSIKFNKDEKLIELLDKLNNTLSNFNKCNQEKGGNDQYMTKLEELLKKYNKTIGDITFEYKDLSDDELTTKFAETFDDESVGNPDDISENKIKFSYIVNGEIKVFSVSLQEKIYAIQDLVNATYAEADNTYYSVTVYEDYVVMCDWLSGRYFKQSYVSENDNYSLTGDRVEVYAEFVTSDEQKELENIRSNYSSIMSELNTYKENELVTKKEELFNSKDYDGIRETKEFVELKNKSKEYSIEELTDKLDKVISNSVKNGTFSFIEKELNKKKPVHVNFAQKLVDEKPKKNSFLDGLLNC